MATPGVGWLINLRYMGIGLHHWMDAMTGTPSVADPWWAGTSGGCAIDITRYVGYIKESSHSDGHVILLVQLYHGHIEINK